MDETFTCPSCGGAALEMEKGGRLLCTSCGTAFMLRPGQMESLPACPRCGSPNLPEAASCSECGVELAKYCARCGTRLELDMRFCDQCGASYESVSSPDGLCQWCRFQNEKEAGVCEKCGACLIASCPSCGAEGKAGASYCRACGFDYETLLESEEEEQAEKGRWPWSRRTPGSSGGEG